MGRRAEDLPADAPVLPGDIAFRFHDTYGFPIDLTIEFAAEQGVRVDREGFEAALASRGVPFVRTPVGDKFMLRELGKLGWDLAAEATCSASPVP